MSAEKNKFVKSRAVSHKKNRTIRRHLAGCYRRMPTIVVDYLGCFYRLSAFSRIDRESLPPGIVHINHKGNQRSVCKLRYRGIGIVKCNRVGQPRATEIVWRIQVCVDIIRTLLVVVYQRCCNLLLAEKFKSHRIFGLYCATCIYHGIRQPYAVNCVRNQAFCRYG